MSNDYQPNDKDAKRQYPQKSISTPPAPPVAPGDKGYPRSKGTPPKKHSKRIPAGR